MREMNGEPLEGRSKEGNKRCLIYSLVRLVGGDAVLINKGDGPRGKRQSGFRKGSSGAASYGKVEKGPRRQLVTQLNRSAPVEAKKKKR